MSSSFLQMAVESRDLSQEIAVCKTEEIHKITTQNFEWTLLSFCEFAKLCKQFFLSQHEKNHVTQLSGNVEDLRSFCNTNKMI